MTVIHRILIIFFVIVRTVDVVKCASDSNEEVNLKKLEEFVNRQILTYIKTFMMKNDRRLRAIIEGAKSGNFQNEDHYLSDTYFMRNGNVDGEIRNLRSDRYYGTTSQPDHWTTNYLLPENESFEYNTGKDNGKERYGQYHSSQFPQEYLSRQAAFKYPTNVVQLLSKSIVGNPSEKRAENIYTPEMVPSVASLTAPTRLNAVSSTFPNSVNGNRNFFNHAAAVPSSTDDRLYLNGDNFPMYASDNGNTVKTATLQSPSAPYTENGLILKQSNRGGLNDWNFFSDDSDVAKTMPSPATLTASVLPVVGAENARDVTNLLKKNGKKYKVLLLDEIEDDGHATNNAFASSQPVQKLPTLTNSPLSNFADNQSSLDLLAKPNLLQHVTSSSSDALKFQAPNLAPPAIIKTAASDANIMQSPSLSANIGNNASQKSMKSSLESSNANFLKTDGNESNFSEPVTRELQYFSFSPYSNIIGGNTGKIVKFFP